MQRQLLINLKYGNVFGISSVWNYLRVFRLRKYCEVRPYNPADINYVLF